MLSRSTVTVPVQDLVEQLSCQTTHLNVFDKKFLPLRHHYSSNIRIDDVIMLLNDTWLVQEWVQHSMVQSVQSTKTQYGTECTIH